MSQDRNSQMSERDEDFFEEMPNKDHIKCLELYQRNTENSGFQCCEDLRDGGLIVKHFLGTLMKRTDEEIYERYLENHKTQHAIQITLMTVESFLQAGLLPCDGEHLYNSKIEEIEDQEPNRAQHDAWLRNKITMQHPGTEIKKLEGEDDIDEKKDKFSVSERTSLTHARLKQKKNEDSQTSQKNLTPTPFSMEVPQEQDEFIDRLRVIKQLESKRKEEKEQQEKKEKQAEFKKEIKNNKFTYDFDGKLLNTKGIKVDKLPPSNYSVSYNFTTQEIDKSRQNKAKRGSQEDISKNPKNSILVTTTGKDEIAQGQGKFGSAKTPFSYEDFVPSSGVTIIYDQRSKEGPKNHEVLDTMANLDLRLRLDNQPLQITRTEYKRLTENGNLNMANTLKQMQDSMQKNKQPRQLSNQPPNSQKNIQQGNASDNKRQLSLTTNSPVPAVLDHSNFKNKTNPMSPNTNSNFNNILGNTSFLRSKKDNLSASLVLDQAKQSKITVSQPWLIKQVINPDDEEQLSSSNRDQGGRLKLPAIVENSPKFSFGNSPVDEFNQRILKGGAEWGKGRQGLGNSYSGLPFYKPNKKVLRSTLSQFYKLPRERDYVQSFKLSKSVTNALGMNINRTENTSPQNEDLLRGTFYTQNSKFSETLRSFKS